MGISQLEIIIKASILPVLVVVLAQFLLKYTPILKNVRCPGAAAGERSLLLTLLLVR